MRRAKSKNDGWWVLVKSPNDFYYYSKDKQILYPVDSTSTFRIIFFTDSPVHDPSLIISVQQHEITPDKTKWTTYLGGVRLYLGLMIKMECPLVSRMNGFQQLLCCIKKLIPYHEPCASLTRTLKASSIFCMAPGLSITTLSGILSVCVWEE